MKPAKLIPLDPRYRRRDGITIRQALIVGTIAMVALCLFGMYLAGCSATPHPSVTVEHFPDPDPPLSCMAQADRDCGVACRGDSPCLTMCLQARKCP